jgi:transcriptional regulator with XRE-family HTH domain
VTTTQPGSETGPQGETPEYRARVLARINERRRDLGLTVEELAARAEYSVGFVTRILLGDSRLTVGSLLAFRDALGCETSDLLAPHPADDPRVEVDSYVIYPDRYADIPYGDREDWVVTVVDGHLNGWSIRRGLGATHSTMAMNGDGTWTPESRHGDNSSRRWTRDEALAIALLNVNTHKVQGLSAAEAVAEGEKARS